MCKSVFKNPEEKARREAFTKLYTVMVSNSYRSRQTRQLMNPAVKAGKQ